MSKLQRNLTAARKRSRRNFGSRARPFREDYGAVDLANGGEVIVADFKRRGEATVPSVMRDAKVIPFRREVETEEDEVAIVRLGALLARQALCAAADISSDLGVSAVAYIALTEAAGLLNELGTEDDPGAA